MSLGTCTLKQPCDTTTYLLEWPKSKTLTIPNAGEDVENQHSCSLLVGIKMVNYFGRQFGNIVLPQDPATWYLTKWVENICPHKNLHINFIPFLFVTAETWKHWRCSSVLNASTRYIPAMKYFSVIKRNELPSHEKTWRNLNTYC